MTKNHSKEYLEWRKVWHESGAWRRYSFEQFVMGVTKLVLKLKLFHTDGRCGLVCPTTLVARLLKS